LTRERRPWAIPGGSPDYPPGLNELPDAPDAVHGVGDRGAVARLEPEAAVTIVGSRRATAYGLRMAEELGRDLAHAGITVVSGLAYGIDAAAHVGAVAAGGPTVAVLGGGPDVIYPASHRGLHRQVLSCGAAISEHPPGTETTKWSFPARNRIMAALARMTIIVEAAEPSGSLITAQRSTELHRDVGAVPGQVGTRVAAGPNSLIRDGAALIRDAQDVLDELLGVGRAQVSRAGPELERPLREVLDRVERGACTPDAVATEAGVASHEAAVALGRLELLGYVVADGSGAYSRTGLAPPHLG
jgi:DNA processing protein